MNNPFKYIIFKKLNYNTRAKFLLRYNFDVKFTSKNLYKAYIEAYINNLKTLIRSDKYSIFIRYDKTNERDPYIKDIHKFSKKIIKKTKKYKIENISFLLEYFILNKTINAYGLNLIAKIISINSYDYKTLKIFLKYNLITDFKSVYWSPYYTYDTMCKLIKKTDLPCLAINCDIGHNKYYFMILKIIADSKHYTWLSGRLRVSIFGHRTAENSKAFDFIEKLFLRDEKLIDEW
jgi:hypothetical protein